jgi:titin
MTKKIIILFLGLLIFAAAAPAAPQKTPPQKPVKTPTAKAPAAPAAASVPAAPSGLKAAVSGPGVNLTWTGSVTNASTATGLVVERRDSSGSYAVLTTLGTNLTAYYDQTIKPGTVYSYRVKAVNNAGASPYSNEAQVTIPDVPAAPSNLTALAQSSTMVVLHWQDNSSNETGFGIERKQSPYGGWGALGTVAANVVQYNDTTAQPSINYVYRVRAINNNGSSTFSNELTTQLPVTAANPLPPTNLTAVQSLPGSIQLSWQKPLCTVIWYKITCTGESFPAAVIGNVGPDKTTFVDTRPEPGQLYTYSIKTSNNLGDSAPSAKVSAALPPKAPSNLTAKAVSPYQIHLTWTNNSNWADGYVVERSVNGGSFAPLDQFPWPKNTSKYDDAKLTPQTTYTYHVIALRSTWPSWTPPPGSSSSSTSTPATAATPVDDGSYNTPVNAH